MKRVIFYPHNPKEKPRIFVEISTLLRGNFVVAHIGLEPMTYRLSHCRKSCISNGYSVWLVKKLVVFFWEGWYNNSAKGQIKQHLTMSSFER